MRDTYVDVAKGVLILLIVSIHAEVFSVIGTPFSFIAVPMFFFMSGFYDHKHSIKTTLKKNLRSLILPAIIWCIFGSLYGVFLRFLKNGCLDFETIDIYNPAVGNGPAWFLYALFFIKIFVCILTRYKIGGAVLFCVALFIGFVGYKLQLPFYVDEAFVGFPLYVTGKFLYGFLRRFFNWSLLTISVGAIFLFLFGYLSYYIVPVGTGSFYYPYYILALFCIMLCFPMILYLSEKIVNNSFLCNLFCSLGNKSLGIMLLHAPMCHTVAVILNRMFVVGSIPWIITFLFAYVIVVALSYYLTIWILKYIPILLGKI